MTMLNENYSTWLTKEQKEAFAKGDNYYVSPFKNCFVKSSNSSGISNSYHESSKSNIFAARRDSWTSRAWS